MTSYPTNTLLKSLSFHSSWSRTRTRASQRHMGFSTRNPTWPDALPSSSMKKGSSRRYSIRSKLTPTHSKSSTHYLDSDPPTRGTRPLDWTRTCLLSAKLNIPFVNSVAVTNGLLGSFARCLSETACSSVQCSDRLFEVSKCQRGINPQGTTRPHAQGTRSLEVLT